MLTAEELKLSPESIALVEKLPEPKNVFKHLMLCLETPRPSKKQEQIVKRLFQVAELLKLEVAQDAGGNVRIRKPASKGRENAPGVCLQAHMDVVCSMNEDTVHDFAAQGVKAFIDGKTFVSATASGKKFLKAEGTTLGADDGAGVAAGLAVLEDEHAVHGPLEVLLTADEEDDFYGIDNLGESPFLRSQITLNLDSELVSEICVGCAGGFEAFVYLPVAKSTASSPTTTSDMQFLQVTVKGLVGGHTGGDIHRGFGNALKIMSQLLLEASNAIGGELHISDLSGGTGASALPRECRATIAISPAHEEQVRAIITARANTLAKEFGPLEPGMTVLIDQTTSVGQFVTAADSTKMLRFMQALPHGVIRKSGEYTETSISMSVCRLEADKLFVHLFARSCITSAMESVQHQLQAVCDLAGAVCQGPVTPFPAWQPNWNSPALKVVRGIMAEELEQEPRVYVVHGGLECGSLIKRYPTMDCVSIGPTIYGAHSPDERLEISTVGKFYNILLRSLDALSQGYQ